jgi:hypothetical protein
LRLVVGFFWPGMTDIFKLSVMSFHIPLSESFKVWVGQPGNWCLIATGGRYFLFLIVSMNCSHSPVLYVPEVVFLWGLVAGVCS